MNKSQAIKVLFKNIDDITCQKYDANELLISSNDILDYFLDSEKKDKEIMNDNFEDLIYLDDVIKSRNFKKLNSQYQLLYPNIEDIETTYSKNNKENIIKELKYA